jgi:hypothetical protein
MYLAVSLAFASVLALVENMSISVISINGQQTFVIGVVWKAAITVANSGVMYLDPFAS